jgi:hypothetical protein
MPRYIDAASVRAVLEWARLIDGMEAALRNFSSGKVLQPVEAAMGLKLVSIYPANSGSGVPTHHAVITRPDTASRSRRWTARP